jgi:PatG C-terminal
MELQRVIGQAPTKGKTDREAMQTVLRARENRHLVWEHCWFLMVQGLQAYQLKPRDSGGFEELIEAALHPNPRPTDLVAVVGERGPISLDCGVTVPTLFVNTIYYARYEEFLSSVPRPEKMTAKQFQPLVDQVFVQLTKTTGAADPERIEAFAAFTDAQMYHVVAEQFAANASLSAVEVHPSSISDTQPVLTLSLVFVDRRTGITRKFCADFNAEGIYPFRVTSWGPCYDR